MVINFLYVPERYTQLSFLLFSTFKTGSPEVQAMFSIVAKVGLELLIFPASTSQVPHWIIPPQPHPCAAI